MSLKAQIAASAGAEDKALVSDMVPCRRGRRTLRWAGSPRTSEMAPEDRLRGLGEAEQRVWETMSCDP